MRLPFAVGYFVDNQEEIYKGMIKTGLAYPLDNLNFKYLNVLTKESYNSMKQIIKKQKKFLDKKSNYRLLREIEKL